MKEEDKNLEEKLENKYYQQVLNAVTFIKEYIYTGLKIVFHPQKTFAIFQRGQSSNLYLKPGAFFAINILLTYMIRELIGAHVYRPLFKVPWLKEWIGELICLSLSFILGTLIFGGLIYFLIVRKKTKILFDKVLRTLYYCSIIFIPITFVKSYISRILVQPLMYIVPRIFSGLPVNLTTGDFVKVAISLVFPLFFILWWIISVYFGIKALKIINLRALKRIIIASYLGFFCLQFVVMTLLFFGTTWNIFKSIKIMAFEDIPKALSTEPPNYFKAALLAEQIA